MAMSSAQACDRCHRRKTRCDKVRPKCGPCARAGSSCVYSERVKEPVYRRDVVERLERRVGQLEGANRSLRQRLARREDDQQQDALSPVSSARADEEHAQTDRSLSNEVANEVSFLSTSAGGERQFLGSASGLLFASLVRASTAQADADAGSEPGRSGSAKPDWGIDDRELPPQQLARSLVEAYLAHDHLCFPFLLPSAVRAAVDLVYGDPSCHASHPFESFVVNMLLAIATSQIHKFNWQALPDAETHHLRATVHLDAVLCEGGLRALQAMLCLCQFRLSSSTKDASGSLWHIVGISARMCYELGLHRESTYKLKPAADRSPGSFPHAFEEQEVQRRCFWCVFALDRVVSITLGRPLAICLEDVDVELPAVDLPDVANTPSVSSPGNERDLVASRSRTAIFVHIVRYRRLCGKLLTSLHRGSRSSSQVMPDLHRVRSALAVELEAWRHDIDSLNLPEMDLSTPIAEARSSFRSKAWYELLYHNSVLLLYRPSSASAPASGDSCDLQRMFASAKQAITLYAYLFRSRKINFSWITLHAAFMAGLSYVYAVSRHIREKRRPCVLAAVGPRPALAQDPSIMEMVNDCRACSNVLVAVSERCNAQKNCHEVFDRLSDAIIADAVELLSASATARRLNQGGVDLAFDSRLHAQGTDKTLQSPSQPFRLPLDPYAPSQIADPYPQEMTEGSGFGGSLTGQPSFAEPLLAADSALRDCFPDLQRMYDAQWGDDAILQLGINWLGEIDPNNGMLPSEVMDGA